MEKQKNVYVVFTEYQLLQALNISTERYNSEKYSNVIHIVLQGRRMKGIDRMQNFNTENIIIEFCDKIPPKALAIKICNTRPDHFFMFQDTTPFNIYLGHKMASLGVEVSLGPDGYGTYEMLNKKYEFLSRVHATFLHAKYLVRNKLYSSNLYIYDYTYANKKFITNIWVTHPEEFNYRGKHQVNVIKLPVFNAKCLQLIKKIFNFNVEFPTSDSIYFFNQPLWNTLLDVEIDFLREVIEAFPDRKIVLKLHPLTSADMISRYKKFKKLHILDGDFPAEILISSLQNCILYSGWSTVLITENKSCNYYFNYPVFKKTNHNIMNQINIHPLKHISMIESVKEMKFPSN